MAIDIEELVMKARQLTATQRVELIARLSAELARDSASPASQPRTLEELMRVSRPWKGLKQPLSAQDDPEVDEFLEWRRQQRQLDRELDEKRQQRLDAIWES